MNSIGKLFALAVLGISFTTLQASQGLSRSYYYGQQGYIGTQDQSYQQAGLSLNSGNSSSASSLNPTNNPFSQTQDPNALQWQANQTSSYGSQDDRNIQTNPNTQGDWMSSSRGQTQFEGNSNPSQSSQSWSDQSGQGYNQYQQGSMYNQRIPNETLYNPYRQNSSNQGYNSSSSSSFYNPYNSSNTPNSPSELGY